MSGYGKFAWFYDRLTENVDHKHIAEMIDSYVRRFRGRKEILLDLACGTGSLSEKMAEMGYDVIGVDGSEEMLNIALDKKFESGLPIQYLRQNMTDLDMYGTIDVTACVLDSLNHLPDYESLKKTLKRVSLFAYPDGMFIFDVNTPYKHKEILGNNAFTYDLDGLFCAWQNYFNEEDGSVDIYLDFFEKNNGGSYIRYQESFTEHIFSREEILLALEETGFQLLGEYDDYSDEPPHEKSQRITYVAKKYK